MTNHYMILLVQYNATDGQTDYYSEMPLDKLHTHSTTFWCQSIEPRCIMYQMTNTLHTLPSELLDFTSKIFCSKVLLMEMAVLKPSSLKSTSFLSVMCTLNHEEKAFTCNISTGHQMHQHNLHFFTVLKL